MSHSPPATKRLMETYKVDSDYSAEISAEDRTIELIFNPPEHRHGSPPADLSRAFSVKIIDSSTSSIVSSETNTASLLVWLRGSVSTDSFVGSLLGQEVEIAKFVCWRHGLVPAIGQDAGIVSSMFGVDTQEIEPRFSGAFFHCTGYFIGLWSTAQKTRAEFLLVDMSTGTLTTERVVHLPEEQ